MSAAPVPSRERGATTVPERVVTRIATRAGRQVLAERTGATTLPGSQPPCTWARRAYAWPSPCPTRSTSPLRAVTSSGTSRSGSAFSPDFASRK